MRRARNSRFVLNSGEETAQILARAGVINIPGILVFAVLFIKQEQDDEALSVTGFDFLLDTNTLLIPAPHAVVTHDQIDHDK
jgi:hypothetical protein